jgi:hypothetical protein
MTWRPPDADPIRAHTSASSNARIDARTRAALQELAGAPVEIQARLGDLDREWNVDRALMLQFAIAGGLSAVMTLRSLARRGRVGGWGALFFTQLAFLANHAVNQWCPPLAVFRRLGLRSQREIDAERAALLAQL